MAAALLLAVTLGSIVGFSYLSNLSTYFVHATALDSARMEAEMLEQIRDHYSEKLVEPNKKIRVALDHAERNDTIPLPARYLIDVADYISRGKSGMRVELYSDYPWRPRPEKDAFQRAALRELQQRVERGEEDLSYYDFPKRDGRQVVRFAKGQLMKKSCLDCHNNPKNNSPKKDWDVGDLVGVLEVTRPLDRDIERTRSGLGGAFVLMGGTGVLMVGLSFAVVLVTRRRNQLKVSG